MQLAPVSPNPSSSRLLHAVPGVCAFRCLGNVIAHAWRGQMTDEIARRFVQTNEAALLAHPEGVSFVSWIQEGVPLPTAEARRLVSQSMSRNSNGIACIAVVTEGSGFWASAMRSAITGIGLLANGGFALRSYRTLDDLTAWLPGHHEQRTGSRVSPAAVRELVAHVQRDAV